MSQFYQDGGLFMHAILVCSVISCVFVIKGLRGARDGKPALRALELSTGVIGASLLFGVTGAAMGVIEIGAALSSVPLEHWPGALARATPIALYPLSFASMLAAPLWLAVTAARYAARKERPVAAA